MGAVFDEKQSKMASCSFLVHFLDILTAIYGGLKILVPIYSGLVVTFTFLYYLPSADYALEHYMRREKGVDVVLHSLFSKKTTTKK
jgi:hypothetical protein